MSSSNPDLTGPHCAADEEVKNIMSSKVRQVSSPGLRHGLFNFSLTLGETTQTQPPLLPTVSVKCTTFKLLKFLYFEIETVLKDVEARLAFEGLSRVSELWWEVS